MEETLPCLEHIRVPCVQHSCPQRGRVTSNYGCSIAPVAFQSPAPGWRHSNLHAYFLPKGGSRLQEPSASPQLAVKPPKLSRLILSPYHDEVSPARASFRKSGRRLMSKHLFPVYYRLAMANTSRGNRSIFLLQESTPTRSLQGRADGDLTKSVSSFVENFYLAAKWFEFLWKTDCRQSRDMVKTTIRQSGETTETTGNDRTA